jgi:signal peptidase I
MGASFYVSRYVLVVYPVEGKSMVPTIYDEDRVLVYRTKNIKHGDIVVFDSEYYQKPLVKRVIGLEGDLIQIKFNEEIHAFEVWRNGERLKEKYINEPMYPPSYREMEVQVPTGKMFFLGDNRNASSDSHNYQEMEDISTIQGKVIMRYKGLDITFFALLEA